MDRGEETQAPIVRIVHHADGTAEVNGRPVEVEPGQDVREAAYLTAVALVSPAAGAYAGAAPVAATRVEPDGTQYPLMLYPGHAVFAANPSVRRAGRSRWASALHGIASLRLRWLVPAACGCILLTAFATVLLHADDPGLAQTKVDSRNVEAIPDAGDASGARAVGAGVAAGTSRALISASARIPSPSPATNRPHTPAATQVRAAQIPSVGDLTLAVFGGDRDDPDVSYVIAVSASNTGPITLTYVYGGSKGHGSTRTQVISGQTEYALAGSFPGGAFCGGTVTLKVSTVPRAANGTVTATTMQAC